MRFLSETKIDFLGARRFGFVISGALLLAGMISLFLQNGPKLGIDFTGGTRVMVKFDKSVEISSVRDALAIVEIEGETFDFSKAEIKLERDKELGDLVSVRLPKLPETVDDVDEAVISKLSDKDASALISEPSLCRFFEACVLESNDGSESAKWVLNAGAKLANEQECNVDDLGITPEQIAGIISLRKNNSVGSSAATQLFELLCRSDHSAESLAESEGLLQVNDENALASWANEAIEAQPQAAEDVRQGKDAAIGRLIGEVMKRSGGSADAGAVRNQILSILRP